MDHRAYRDQSRRAWGSVASSWAARSERAEAAMRVVNDWLIGRADPQPGQVVLDVAAGPGGLGHRVAPLVGSSGRVISTDSAPEMVEVARGVGASRGLDNVEYRTLDAEQMDLDDNSVDVVLCRSGYMLMADPVAALGETRRVLRPGGPLAFSVFGTAAENPFISRPIRTLVRLGYLPAPAGAGGPGAFSLADPARIVELVTAASLARPDLEVIEFAYVYADEDDVWDSIVQLQAPLAAAVKKMSEDEHETARNAIIDAFAPYRANEGSYHVPARAWVALTR